MFIPLLESREQSRLELCLDCWVLQPRNEQRFFINSRTHCFQQEYRCTKTLLIGWSRYGGGLDE
jgi:hypothetical protein